MKHSNALIATTIVGLLGGAVVPALADEDVADWTLDMRYRIESVEQAELPEDAIASTLRTRFGLRTERVKGWQGFVEFEDVRVIGSDDYNSTKNGKIEYPVVADPEDTELNQAYLGYRFDSGNVTLGRQRFNLDNQRFFGAVGFRQNEQTLDAAVLKAGIGDVEVTAATILRANRVFGAHHPNPVLSNTDMETLVIDADYDLGDMKLGAFVHAIDLENSPAASHMNLGVRASGKRETFDWRIEFAQQSDYADGAAMVDADYYRLDAGYTASGVRVGLVREVLGGNGRYAFQTPFATLHKFNGVTDKFLVTPVNGLVDTALSVEGKLGEWALGGAWHQFDSDAGSLEYGSEISVHAGRKLTKNLGFSVKLGDYRAADFATDTTKLWLALDMQF